MLAIQKKNLKKLESQKNFMQQINHLKIKILLFQDVAKNPTNL